MTLISITKQQQLLIYSTHFRLQTEHRMGNFIRENIAKREMLAGKKEVIPIETKPSWELLAALYPETRKKTQKPATRERGLTNTGCLCLKPSVCRQFPRISPQRLPGCWTRSPTQQPPGRAAPGAAAARTWDHLEWGSEFTPISHGQSLRKHPGIAVREAPAQEAHVWPCGWGTFFSPSLYSWPWNQHMIQKPRKLTHRSQHCLGETVVFVSSILSDTHSNPQISQGLQSWSWTSPERCCRWRKGFHHLCWQLCGAHGSNNVLFSLKGFK